VRCDSRLVYGTRRKKQFDIHDIMKPNGGYQPLRASFLYYVSYTMIVSSIRISISIFLLIQVYLYFNPNLMILQRFNVATLWVSNPTKQTTRLNGEGRKASKNTIQTTNPSILRFDKWRFLSVDPNPNHFINSY
jgi:hypothetical protein